MPSLIVKHQSTGGQRRIQLRESPFTIGRGQDNDLILSDKSISKQHCRIQTADGNLAIEDLGSSTGTFLNEEQIKNSAPLKTGDRLIIGPYAIEIMGDGQTSTVADSPAAPPQEQASSPQPDQSKSSQIGPAAHKKMLTSIRAHPELARLDSWNVTADEFRERATTLLRKFFEEDFGLGSMEENQMFQLLNEALGFGALDRLLADSTVDEIMVNGYDTIYTERKGKIAKTNVAFKTENQLLNILHRILGAIGRRIDHSSPMVDARLPDGSRVNAIIPPLSVTGPLITIRKFARQMFTDKDLIRRHSLSNRMSAFLKLAMQHRCNIIVSGGTGSGKTTLLNILSSHIANDERIITIEDSVELQLNQPHILQLESRPPNIGGEGAITIRDLLRNSLRMRPDRIVVGECRGGEALDMLQAMNTGHDGSLTTIHANSPRDALNRLETLVLLAGIDLPIQAIRKQIASAVDLIVQQNRFPDGSRKVTSISEVTGLEGDTFTMQEIFHFEDKGTDGSGKAIGRHKANESIPKFVLDVRNRGHAVNLDLFQETKDG